jgi:hypothetical protein
MDRGPILLLQRLCLADAGCTRTAANHDSPRCFFSPSCVVNRGTLYEYVRCACERFSDPNAAASLHEIKREDGNFDDRFSAVVCSRALHRGRYRGGRDEQPRCCRLGSVGSPQKSKPHLSDLHAERRAAVRLRNDPRSTHRGDEPARQRVVLLVCPRSRIEPILESDVVQRKRPPNRRPLEKTDAHEVDVTK